VKISNKNFSFFSSLNQYFPHIPFVASKNQIEHRKRHLLSKFDPSSIFTKNSKVILIFFTLEFALEISKFQNSKYEVHQSSPTDEG
jgi:hypothetical protein